MFSKFTPDSFEQLIRALALHTLGPGVTTFGDGPDGGREARFDGLIPFPHPPSQTWNGYGVVQAKFKTKPETTNKQQSWALAELKKELERWGKRSKRPDYYIFVTNVELTPATGGGREKIELELAARASLLGLKDWRIWDGNQLRAMLDTNGELRRRYATHFASDDILAQLIEDLDSVNTTTSAQIIAYLSREFSADRHARLSQAGDRTDQAPDLTRVFTDLPAFEMQSWSEPRRCSALGTLQAASELTLDPASTEPRADQRPTPSRYILVGGPGSGKSTVTQYLAQLHRAAVLASHSRRRTDPKIVSVAESMLSNAATLAPKAPRIPFRVELRHLANLLATDKVSSLSEFLRTQISSDATDFSHSRLLKLMSRGAWLLILDGLDEVPASSNRAAVLGTINDFLNETRAIESNLMVLATTRPEGYDGAFSDQHVSCLNLQPLDTNEALTYAARYIDARYDGDRSKAEEVTRTLQEAVQSKLVQNLMRSPLQVTFIVTIAGASGKPSDSRWQLFSDYNRIIYDRELQKAVAPYSTLLSQRRMAIQLLHQRVGLLLQGRAETSGGTDSQLSIPEFEKLASECLREAGLSDAELKTEIALLMAVTVDRLVFLTRRTATSYSFEVRSLQEFMAASCILAADSSVAIDRTKALSKSSFWRNTVLFVVGAFYGETHLWPSRERIRTLCDDLNKEDSPEPQLFGSRLSLDILEASLAQSDKLASRHFVEMALRLIELGNPELLHRLATAYNHEYRAEYERSIKLYLGSFPLAANLLLMMIAEPWALALADAHWPMNRTTQLELIGDWTDWTGRSPGRGSRRGLKSRALLAQEWYPRRLSNVLFENSPRASRGAVQFLFGQNEPQVPNVVRFLGARTSGSLIADPDGPIHVLIRPLDSPINSLLQSVIADAPSDAHTAWSLVRQLADFVDKPSSESLVRFLRNVKEKQLLHDALALVQLCPWPVAAALRHASAINDIESVESQIAQGAFGDAEDWLQLEDRVRMRESIETLWHTKVGRIAIAGHSDLSVVINGLQEPNTQLLLGRLLALFETESDFRWLLGEIVTVLGSTGRLLGHFNATRVSSLLPYVEGSRLISGVSVADFKANPAEWVELFEAVSQRIGQQYYYFHYNTPLLDSLVDTQLATPKDGLARIIAYAPDLDNVDDLVSKQLSASAPASETEVRFLLRIASRQLSQAGVNEALTLIPTELSRFGARIACRRILNQGPSAQLLTLAFKLIAHIGDDPLAIEYARSAFAQVTAGLPVFADAMLQPSFREIRPSVQS